MTKSKERNDRSEWIEMTKQVMKIAGLTSDTPLSPPNKGGLRGVSILNAGDSSQFYCGELQFSKF